MKNLLFTSMMFLCTGTLFAQVNQEWVQTYAEGNVAPWNRGMALDNSGNVYVAGRYNNGSDIYMLLQKYNAAGDLLWTEYYLPAGSNSARASAVMVDGNGDVIITGADYTSNTGFTRKYDLNGQLLWSQPTTIRPFSMTLDEANNIYITSWDFVNNPMQIIKYNASGNLLWTATSTSVNGGAHGKIFYKNGFVYRTGGATITISGKNVPVMYTRKYNASSGSLVWAKTYYHADKLSQAGWDLVVDASDNVYVFGYVNIKSGKNQNSNWVTLKYNSAGTQQWAKIYDGNGNDNSSNGFNDTPTGMTIDNGGNIIVSGSSYTTTGSFSSQDLTTIKYNSAGTQLWLKTYDDATHGFDEAKAITSDASENIYITGVSNTASGNDAITIKYNASGTQQWVMLYDGGTGSNETSWNILTNPGGDVYAAGNSSEGPNSFLVKYSQVGSFMPGNDLSNREKKVMSSWKIFPNPANEILFVNSNSNENLGLIRITDHWGRTILERYIEMTEIQLNIQALPPGIYNLNSARQKESFRFSKLK